MLVFIKYNLEGMSNVSGLLSTTNNYDSACFSEMQWASKQCAIYGRKKRLNNRHHYRLSRQMYNHCEEEMNCWGVNGGP